MPSRPKRKAVRRRRPESPAVQESKAAGNPLSDERVVDQLQNIDSDESQPDDEQLEEGSNEMTLNVDGDRVPWQSLVGRYLRVPCTKFTTGWAKQNFRRCPGGYDKAVVHYQIIEVDPTKIKEHFMASMVSPDEDHKVLLEPQEVEQWILPNGPDLDLTDTLKDHERPPEEEAAAPPPRRRKRRRRRY